MLAAIYRRDARPSPRLRRWRRCVGDAEQLAVALPTPPAQRRRRRSARLTPAAPTATRRTARSPSQARARGAAWRWKQRSPCLVPCAAPCSALCVCAAPCLSCHLYCSASCSALCLCCPLLLCSVSCFSGYCVVGCIQDTRAAALLSPAPWLAAPAPAVPGTDDLVGCDGCRRPCITSPVAGGARPGCPRTNGFMAGLTGLPPMRAPRARPLADAAPAPAVPGRTTWLAAGCRAADPALAPAPWLTRRPPRLSQYERLELVMRLFLRALQRLLLGLLSQSHEPSPNRGHAWQLRPTGASRRAHARRPAAHQTKTK